MVFINDKKFACESCIKGHRSSSCKHTDRPLYEIKKKGRPVSQCDKCRELRKSKKLHSKCICNSTDDGSIPNPESASSSRQKWGRFVPIAPSLPNGISDATPSSSSVSVSVNPKQRVDSLLNPCNCKSVWKCRCRAEQDRNKSSVPPLTENLTTRDNGLATLARAAAMCCSGQSSRRHNLASTNPPRPADPGIIRREISKGHSSRPSTPPSPSRKQHRSILSNQHTQSIPGPSLPPILFSSPSSSGTSQIPEFPTIPPISIMKSLAGSGCTCGLNCACPGCVEHRGEEHTSADRADCTSGGCTTCVDWQGGIELPVTSLDSTINNQNTSTIHQFLARAAALPLPPHTRKGLRIDPTNVLIYPTDLFSRDSAGASGDHTAGGLDMRGRGAAFGLIKVPKMECCGGRCSCPEGTCGCGKSCDGRCGEHGDEGEHNRARPVNSDQRLSQEVDVPSVTLTSTNPMLSTSKASAGCCANRLATAL